MDASCKIQENIHVLLRLIHKSMCPGFWVHIILTMAITFFDKYRLATKQKETVHKLIVEALQNVEELK